MLGVAAFACWAWAPACPLQRSRGIWLRQPSDSPRVWWPPVYWPVLPRACWRICHPRRIWPRSSFPQHQASWPPRVTFFPRGFTACASVSAATARSQGRTSPGRSGGIDRDRLGWRRARAIGSTALAPAVAGPGRRSSPGALARRGIVGNGRVVLVAGRTLAFSAAHLVAQVRRRGVDGARFSTEPSEGTNHTGHYWRSRGPGAVRRAPRAFARRGPQHDGDQPLAVAARGGAADCSRMRR